ncbi:hypothetical protein, partial [Nitratifractor sp.]
MRKEKCTGCFPKKRSKDKEGHSSFQPKLCISQHAICIDHRRHGRHIQSLDAPSGCAYVLAVHLFRPSIDT